MEVGRRVISEGEVGERVSVFRMAVVFAIGGWGLFDLNLKAAKSCGAS